MPQYVMTAMVPGKSFAFSRNSDFILQETWLQNDCKHRYKHASTFDVHTHARFVCSDSNACCARPQRLKYVGQCPQR